MINYSQNYSSYGSLALVGSGEYLPVMSGFEKSLLEDGIRNGKVRKFLQIPTAAGCESEESLNYWKRLGQEQAERIGVEAIFLPIFRREDAFKEEYVRLIENTALMYISGGDPEYLAEVLIDTPAWGAIVNNWRSGGSLAGCSAGAMVLSTQIPKFRESKKAISLGLNLLSEISVIPHFDKFFSDNPAGIKKVLLDFPNDCIVIGIDELSGIVKRNGDTYWRAFGEGKIHIVKGLPYQELYEGQEIRLVSQKVR